MAPLTPGLTRSILTQKDPRQLRSTSQHNPTSDRYKHVTLIDTGILENLRFDLR